MIFFYMLVFNLGYLPNLPLASAGYGCSGCCAKNANGNCVPNDEECACWEECSPSCSCRSITTGLGACEYFDSCNSGTNIASGDGSCPSCSGGLCSNNVCSNTYETTCMDPTALCHVKLQCS